jgi:hypothetical protein
MIDSIYYNIHHYFPLFDEIADISLFSFSGFIIGINLTLSHLFGKAPILKYPLYMAVKNQQQISKLVYKFRQ